MTGWKVIVPEPVSSKLSEQEIGRGNGRVDRERGPSGMGIWSMSPVLMLGHILFHGTLH